MERDTLLAPSTTDRLAPVLELIRRRYREHLTLKDLAETVHLHPSYFSAMFKASVGVSPLAYLARQRLQRAEHLLLTTDEPLRTIASATGFSDRSHLSRAFRRAMGVAPTTYRRSRDRSRLQQVRAPTAAAIAATRCLPVHPASGCRGF